MSTMLAILKIMMLNLKVAPTVQWDLTGWQGADTQLNKVQVTATITVTPRGPTRNIFNGAQTKTKTFYLNPRTGNQKVDFVYDNYAERLVFASFFYLIALLVRFGDNQELEFNVQIKYQLPRCTLNMKRVQELPDNYQHHVTLFQLYPIIPKQLPADSI